MAYFICEKQGRCCPHEFYDSIEQAIADSEDGVPCDHLIEVAPVRHGRWIYHPDDLFPSESTQECSCCHDEEYLTLCNENYCPNCGANMDLHDECEQETKGTLYDE